MPRNRNIWREKEQLIQGNETADDADRERVGATKVRRACELFKYCNYVIQIRNRIALAEDNIFSPWFSRAKHPYGSLTYFQAFTTSPVLWLQKFHLSLPTFMFSSLSFLEFFHVIFCFRLSPTLTVK